MLSATAFFLAIACVLAGLGFVGLAKRFDFQLGEPSKASLLLLPVLMFLVGSGKLAEFEVSGLKAKFREATSERVIDTARAADLAISSPEANEPNFFSEAFFQQCRPYYVLSEKSAKKNDKIDTKAVLNIAAAVRTSIVCGRFTGLVVVDSARKPLGFFARDQFIELIRLPLVVYDAMPVDPQKLFSDIMSTELGVVLANPEIRAGSAEAHKVTVAWNEKLDDAHKKLVENSVDVAMIVDRMGRFDGIITRPAIESRVIGRLIEAAR